MSTTNILDLNNRIDELEKNSGGGGSSDSAKRSDIATEFNTTTAYTAGCFVYHEGKLYQFNTDHAAGAWDPTDVVAANVTDQVVSNKAAIDALDAEVDAVIAKLDSGVTQNPTAIEPNTTAHWSVSFNKTFNQIPAVTVAVFTGSPSLRFASIFDVTTTGFDVYLTNNQSSQAVANTIKINWIAVE